MLRCVCECVFGGHRSFLWDTGTLVLNILNENVLYNNRNITKTYIHILTSTNICSSNFIVISLNMSDLEQIDQFQNTHYLKNQTE